MVRDGRVRFPRNVPRPPHIAPSPDPSAPSSQSCRLGAPSPRLIHAVVELVNGRIKQARDLRNPLHKLVFCPPRVPEPAHSCTVCALLPFTLPLHCPHDYFMNKAGSQRG